MEQEDACIYAQRYNLLCETVRAFAITLDQQYGSFSGVNHEDFCEVIENHHRKHPCEDTKIAVELVETFRKFIRNVRENQKLYEHVKLLQSVYL
jgi:hypothetical protein